MSIYFRGEGGSVGDDEIVRVLACLVCNTTFIVMLSERVEVSFNISRGGMPAHFRGGGGELVFHGSRCSIGGGENVIIRVRGGCWYKYATSTMVSRNTRRVGELRGYIYTRYIPSYYCNCTDLVSYQVFSLR